MAAFYFNSDIVGVILVKLLFLRSSHISEGHRPGSDSGIKVRLFPSKYKYCVCIIMEGGMVLNVLVGEGRQGMTLSLVID